MDRKDKGKTKMLTTPTAVSTFCNITILCIFFAVLDSHKACGPKVLEEINKICMLTINWDYYLKNRFNVCFIDIIHWGKGILVWFKKVSLGCWWIIYLGIAFHVSASVYKTGPNCAI